MRYTNKVIMDMPLEKMESMADSFSKVADSKVLTDGEALELKTQILSFGNALTKCGNGHLVPPELKPSIEAFEKADFDIKKLPANMKMSLDKTYNDLKVVCDKHPGEFKNTQAKLYCNIYNFFNNATNLKFLNRIRKDPIVKKSNLSKESFDNDDEYISYESLERWLANTNDDYSFEGIIGATTATMNAIKAGVISLTGSVSGTLVTIQTVATIVAVLLVIAIILLSVLLLTNMQYKAELADILKHITGSDAVEENGTKTIRSDAPYVAAKNMVMHTNPLTKNMLYKPCAGALSSFNKICNKGYQWFDKTLTSAKNVKSKEDLDHSQEVLPAFLIKAGAIISGASIPFWIIFSIVCVLIFIKPAVYFIYRTKLKGYEFFKEEADMLLVNIEDIEERLKNTTSQAEKDRLSKIIEKQRAVYHNLSAIASWFYKTQQDAAVDTRDDLRDDDSINYDQYIEEVDKENSVVAVAQNDTSYDPSDDPVNVSNTNNTQQRKPIVIF